MSSISTPTSSVEFLDPAELTLLMRDILLILRVDAMASAFARAGQASSTISTSTTTSAPGVITPRGARGHHLRASETLMAARGFGRASWPGHMAASQPPTGTHTAH